VKTSLDAAFFPKTAKIVGAFPVPRFFASVPAVMSAMEVVTFAVFLGVVGRMARVMVFRTIAVMVVMTFVVTIVEIPYPRSHRMGGTQETSVQARAPRDAQSRFDSIFGDRPRNEEFGFGSRVLVFVEQFFRDRIRSDALQESVRRDDARRWQRSPPSIGRQYDEIERIPDRGRSVQKSTLGVGVYHGGDGARSFGLWRSRARSSRARSRSDALFLGTFDDFLVYERVFRLRGLSDRRFFADAGRGLLSVPFPVVVGGGFATVHSPSRFVRTIGLENRIEYKTLFICRSTEKRLLIFFFQKPILSTDFDVAVFVNIAARARRVSQAI
jgi:hypothetical protein